MWFTWKGKDGYGGGGGYYFFVDKKTLGKWQEHGEFGINWSMATLNDFEFRPFELSLTKSK